MKDKTPIAYIGTSGYAYDKWHGMFYPEGVNKKRLLEYYAQFYNTVEINNSFYGLPSSKALQTWQDEVPPGFQLSLKVSRYLTHNKKLLDSADPVNRFFDVAKHLAPGHRGPLLMQLPPNFKPHYERLRETLSAFKAAFGRARWRVAVEVRDSRWYGTELNSLLDEFNAALVIHDMPESRIDEPNSGSDFIYVRFHGPRGDYHGRYGREGLAGRAGLIRHWLEQGRDAYAFFNNDADGYAPDDARILADLVNG